MDAAVVERYYDSVGDRLLYVKQSATPNFWDAHWKQTMGDVFQNPPAHRYTVWLTKRYLSPGAVVLEGGCGIGDKVYALDKAGFIAKGVDFAPSIVALTKKQWPHLDIKQGDVRRLATEAASVDGYWSLGVIEHFIDGYGEIAAEMERVLRPGGYLFLTFPMMNRVRTKRALRGEITAIGSADVDDIKANFYQYALNPAQVISDFQSLGFTLRHQGGLSALDCLSEELPWFNVIARLMRRLPLGFYVKLGLLVDMLVGKYSGHVAILVLQKNLDS